jgi:hypothetical protein
LTRKRPAVQSRPCLPAVGIVHEYRHPPECTTVSFRRRSRVLGWTFGPSPAGRGPHLSPGLQGNLDTTSARAHRLTVSGLLDEGEYCDTQECETLEITDERSEWALDGCGAA